MIELVPTRPVSKVTELKKDKESYHALQKYLNKEIP